MASEWAKEQRKIQPVTRVRTPMPPSARRHGKGTVHRLRRKIRRSFG